MKKKLTVRGLFEIDRLADAIAAAGLSRAEVQNKAKLFADCGKALRGLGLSEDAAVRAFFVPGRIEVLGKHTDYAGGRSIVAAAEMGFCIAAAGRQDQRVRIVNIAEGEQAELATDGGIRAKQGHWSSYAATVVGRLVKNFSGPLRGADIAFVSDLPVAAGMSSSSALMVGLFLVLSAFNELASREQYRGNIRTVEDLAGYLGTIENGQSFASLAGDKGVGTFGGSEDHTAILCCKAGQVSQYSYCPVRLERTLELPGDFVFAVASSGVAAEKTGAAMEKYNRISELSRCATEVWNRATGRSDEHLAAVIAAAEAQVSRVREVLQKCSHERFDSEELLRRFEHFVSESERIIPAAGDALRAGDIEQFGMQVAKSQELAERLLANQVPETVFLARRAREAGAVAASAFGAGFGGSVWALIDVEKSEKFIADWSTSYREQFPDAAERAVFSLTRPGPAAFELHPC